MRGVTSLTLTMLVGAWLVPASTACAQNTESRLLFDPTSVQHTGKLVPRRDEKPATTVQQAPAAKAGRREAATSPRTTGQRPQQGLQLESGAEPESTGRGRTQQKETPSMHQPLGRIPLETGALSIETETKLKPYESPDGRRLRGLEGGSRRASEPNYFGLSLSMPTTEAPAGSAPPPMPPVRTND